MCYQVRTNCCSPTSFNVSIYKEEVFTRKEGLTEKKSEIGPRKHELQNSSAVSLPQLNPRDRCSGPFLIEFS